MYILCICSICTWKYINIVLSAFVYVNDFINSNNTFADKEAYNTRLFQIIYVNTY